MRAAGTPVILPQSDAPEDLEDHIARAMDSLRDYGVHYLLKNIAEQTGILRVLKESVPTRWMELLTLSFYLVAGNRPLMYLQDWLEENESYPVGNMSSPRISELLSALGQKERNAFFTGWVAEQVSEEYLALDITSISSYSRMMNECEWGYNRDGEALPQLNLCLLFGEKNELPVYQTGYSGSLKDVSTLGTTVAEMKAISGEKRLVLVMDKGFYSEKNVQTLLNEYGENEFLIAMPFTCNLARELVEGERRTVDRAANIIKTASSPIRGVSRPIDFSGRSLRAHIFYNPEKELADRNELYEHINHLKETVEGGKVPAAVKQEVEKYLSVEQEGGGKGKPLITIKQDVIERELAVSPWMVIIGNGGLTTQAAYDIYRKKDVVEKGFMKYKNMLGMSRLRVHDDERARNKNMAAFIALVIVSHIHKIMKQNNMYRRMTMEKLLLTMAKIKIIVINGRHIMRPLTKEQKEILKIFSIPIPDVG